MSLRRRKKKRTITIRRRSETPESVFNAKAMMER